MYEFLKCKAVKLLFTLRLCDSVTLRLCDFATLCLDDSKKTIFADKNYSYDS